MLGSLVFALLALSVNTATMPNEPYIIYSNITNLHALDLNTYARTDVLGGLDRAIPLGFDNVNKHIYFGEHTLGLIYRANYDGTSKTLLMEGVKNIEGVAIDWIGRNMYWTTYQSETIEVSKINGRYRKVLLNTELEYPRGLAVDPIAGYLFWSDWGTKAAIERCALDGTDRIALVTSNITWPNGVTLDTSAKKLYWIDADKDTISSIDYDGKNRQIIFQESSLALSQFHGFDLDFSGDSMYYTDWLSNAIHGIKISTGVEFINISVPTTNSIKGAMGLRVIDGSKQQTGSSNCGNNNGGCEQLCFHKVPFGFSCGCELGMKLANDGKSCEDAFKDEFLMFADADAGKIYQMQLDSINVRPIPVPFDENTNISRPVALEYDKVEDRVYWSDVTLKIICRAFRNGTGFEVLFDDIGVADGLTIDFAGRQLYWTSETNNTVEVSKLDGSYRKILIRWHLDNPRDIIVDSVGGYMYWTDWGKFPRIERAYMNGENRIDLVNTSLKWPNGLTIDHVYNTLYWADAYEDNIESMDLATLKRKVVLNKKFLIFGWLFPGTSQVNHPYGLTSLHDHLYWTDWSTDTVYRADTNTGANIRIMAAGLGKPMDIHAYRAIPKPQNRTYYTFSFPNHGSNFSCYSSTQCPQIDAPPACPPGYTEARENSTCGLYCRDIVGYTYRCPCKDWMSCAVKERYLYGCRLGYYSSFRVRECTQVVKPGRCPSNGSQGSKQACNSDDGCPGEEKCCNSTCSKPATLNDHPCQQNNGGCQQLCFAVPGGHKCGCKEGYLYSVTTAKCEIDTRPITPPPTPQPKRCAPHPAPKHGSVSCDGDGTFVPDYGECRFTCDAGYELVGWSWDLCIDGEWIDDTPTCNISTKPRFSHCPNDTTVPTDPGKSYATVNWKMPTATDKDGLDVPVDIWPLDAKPPAQFEIGWNWVDLTATKDGESVYCFFFITVEDREPPSFGSTCPNDMTLYTENDYAIRLPRSFKKPNATDNSKKVSVNEKGFPKDSFFPIGTTVVSFTAKDYTGLNATCTFNVTIINVCAGVSCTHGAKCMLDPTKKDSHMCACNTLCPQINDPVCGSDGQTYNNLCLMNVSQCTTSKTITAVKKGKCDAGDCSAAKCAFGSTCKVVNGLAKCDCDDLKCADGTTPVCGSDGKTYGYKCLLQKEQCAEQTAISVIHNGECGCDDLKPRENGFDSTSTMSCKYDNSAVKCTVSCKSGNNAVIPEFLKIQCYKGKWIRSNKQNKYVRLAYAHSPPKCYEPTNKSPILPYCSSGHILMENDICVPCPPGSYYDGTNCIPCPVTQYQDNAGQTECKKCVSPYTSTVTGAEDCYYDHSKNAVKMILENEKSDVEKDKISNDIAQGLTRLCKTTKCTFVSNTARRRKRDDNNYEFKAEHVIILSLENSNSVNTDTEVLLFVLDPSSTSLLPDKALSSEQLKKLLDQGQKYLTYVNMKSVSTVKSRSSGEESTGEKSSSKAPVVAGVVVAIVVLIAIVFVAWLYIRRRKNKSSVPPVQFDRSEGGGTTTIGSPMPGVSNPQYENQEQIRDGLHKGFVNKVYEDVNAPPPYSVNTPIPQAGANSAGYETPHIYEMPDGDQAGALPAKENLPAGAVVDIVPPKYEAPTKADSPVKFFHKRSKPNSYEVPAGAEGGRSTTPDAEAELRLEPPPKFDDAKLQVIRDKAASSILPNVPRKKKVDPVLDSNANENTKGEGKSHYQNLQDVTKEQSET